MPDKLNLNKKKILTLVYVGKKKTNEREMSIRERRRKIN